MNVEFVMLYLYQRIKYYASLAIWVQSKLDADDAKTIAAKKEKQTPQIPLWSFLFCEKNKKIS